MVTINNITPQQNNGSQIEYTVNFQATNHNITGSFVATQDEVDNAFKQQNNGDAFFGLKQLVLTRLQTEATNALGTK